MRVRCGIFSSMRAVLSAGGIVVLAAQPCIAGPAWDDIRPVPVGARAIENGRNILAFKAPYRAADQRTVPISVEAAFADGRKVRSAVTFLVDENPSPLAAVFRFADDRDRAALGINIRLDQASPARAIVEASDGRLSMAEQFIKASGLGVCAAPPTWDPDFQLASSS